MASMKTTFPDDLVKKLASLGSRSDQVLETVLTAGAEAVQPILTSHVSGAIGRNTKQKSESTGELAGSIGISPVRVDENGVYDVKVGFHEPRGDGKRNAMIAGILEHGKSNQPPRPFLKAARTASQKPALQAMTEAFQSEVDDL